MNRYETCAATLIGCAMLAVSATSCISQEPLNAECDIVSATLPDDVLNRTPIIENNIVEMVVRNTVPLTALAPEFTLTPGATITPASGTVRDFTDPQQYVVTSQDGQWSKTYTVTIKDGREPFNLNYNFGNIAQVTASTGKYTYDVFYEVDANGTRTMTWASANAAFALTGQGTTPNTFPCYQADTDNGTKCAVLVTRSTGSFGAGMKKPLAAGSMFIGSFDMKTALSQPLAATHFGTPFYSIPLAFSGTYKFTPGETYCEPDAAGKLIPVAGETDKFNIYAVLFEVTTDMQWLDGTNVLSADNPNIIAVAMIPEADRDLSGNWTEFSVPFEYRDGKTIDLEKLENGAYSITIALSSSAKGDFFAGAIGSTLSVDKLQLHCK